MIKVFGFARRAEHLSQDEYRAALIGYHSSHVRRRNRIRGYIVNVRANRPMPKAAQIALDGLEGVSPACGQIEWDAYEQLMFDPPFPDGVSFESGVKDRPGPQGLEVDRSANGNGNDAFLNRDTLRQVQFEEHQAVPVCRPEHKVFKLALFTRRQRDLSPACFKSTFIGSYSALVRNAPGLLGFILNFPASSCTVSVLDGEWPSWSESNPQPDENTTELGFNGMAEFWFTSPGAFASWRENSAQQLRVLERDLFESLVFREVDESVVVLPDRLPPATFYHR